MAEVAAAAAAMHLGADHAVGPVGRGLDRSRDRIVEARPASAALELLLRVEQRLVAPGAIERAGAFLIIQRATARPLGAVLAHDVKLFGRKNLAPLRVGVGHGILLGVRFGVHVGILFGRVSSWRGFLFWQL